MHIACINVCKIADSCVSQLQSYACSRRSWKVVQQNKYYVQINTEEGDASSDA
jgi:hypothetical protein